MPPVVNQSMPMFPLGSVLFPYALLPLHVFEPRYRVLMFDLQRQEPEFGVVLIERGLEVGGGDQRFQVGTVARILQAAETADGRWAVIAQGTHRIEVTSWLEDDPYPRAEVAHRPDSDPPAEGAALSRTEAAVRKALALKAELDEPSVPASVELDQDPEIRLWQLAAIAPLGPADQQRVLSEDGADRRSALLTELVEDAASVLAYRLAEG